MGDEIIENCYFYLFNEICNVAKFVTTYKRCNNSYCIFTA